MGHRVGHIPALAALQAQPEAQIHVFDVAEEPRVESPGLDPILTAVERSSGAGRNHSTLGERTRHLRHRLSVAAPPHQTAHVILVAGAVEHIGRAVPHQP